jgi:aerobic-type carbon monoxide dehydrogenase small subunit (CoxS/CutS family)
MARSVAIKVDGASHTLSVDDPDMPLLYALRDELGLNNPRFGCGLGQCGACTVHLDGVAVRSCMTPLSSVDDRAVTTLVGLGSEAHPHPLQTAFIEEQAMLCGYCLNGWLMTAAAILREKPQANEAEIRAGLTGLKCRCGAHMAMLRAVQRVADSNRAGASAPGLSR